jgi:hypothetical protein
MIARLTVCIGLAAGLSGCLAGESYLIDRPTAVAIARMSPKERAQGHVPAVRVKRGVPVRLRAEAVRLDTAVPEPDGRVRVKAAVRSPTVTAGAVLTYVGSVTSIVGSGIFFAYVNQPGTLRTVGMALAGAAEPVQWAGIGLWVGGLLRRPQEPGPVTR